MYLLTGYLAVLVGCAQLHAQVSIPLRPAPPRVVNINNQSPGDGATLTTNPNADGSLTVTLTRQTATATGSFRIAPPASFSGVDGGSSVGFSSPAAFTISGTWSGTNTGPVGGTSAAMDVYSSGTQLTACRTTFAATVRTNICSLSTLPTETVSGTRFAYIETVITVQFGIGAVLKSLLVRFYYTLEPEASCPTEQTADAAKTPGRNADNCPAVSLKDAFPDRGASSLWGSPAEMPRFTARVSYVTTSQSEITMELTTPDGALLNVADNPRLVNAGQGSVKVTMEPFGKLVSGGTVWLRAVMTPRASDGKPLRSIRSEPIIYNVSDAPQVELTPGCSGFRFVPIGPTEGATPLCPSAVRVDARFSGREAFVSGQLNQLWGKDPKGMSPIPPRITKSGEAFEVDLYGGGRFRPPFVDSVDVRIELRNPDTDQTFAADPLLYPFFAVYAKECNPRIASVLDLDVKKVDCTVAYSTWHLATFLQWTSPNEPRTRIADVPPGSLGEYVDSTALPPVTSAISNLFWVYSLATQNDILVSFSAPVGYSRVAQSLDTGLTVAANSNAVSEFVGGTLTILNATQNAFPSYFPDGKVGRLIRMWDDICSGGSKGVSTAAVARSAMRLAGRKTNCLELLRTAYEIAKKVSLDRAAESAPVAMLPLATTWFFENKLAANGKFLADLKLEYTAAQFPQHPEFDESKLTMVAYDPDAGTFEILPTQLNLANRTATARIDHLMPYYSLAMIAPLSSSILRSPVALPAGPFSSSLVLNNAGGEAARSSIRAYDPAGTPAGTVPIPVAASGQNAGRVPGETAQSVEITSDRPTVGGVVVLAGSGQLETLPLETQSSNTWVLSLVEETAAIGTVVYVANAGSGLTNLDFELFAPDGSSLGAATATIAARATLSWSLTSLFSDIPRPFTGYLTVTAGQDITAAALLMSGGALAAVGGKSTPAARLHSPLLGGEQMNAVLNLVNLGDARATVTVRAIRANGTALAPASFNINANAQLTRSLAELFNGDEGPYSLVIESPQPTLIGDIILSSDLNPNTARTLLPLRAAETSLMIPFVMNEGDATSLLAITNTSAQPAAVQVSVFNPAGARVGSRTLNLSPNASAADTMSALTGAAPPGGYLTLTSNTPVTAMGLIGTRSRDAAAVPGIRMPGTDGGTVAPPSVPVITLSPQPPYNFGTATVGSSPTITFTMTNSGTTAVTLNSLVRGNGQFTLAEALPLTINPGQSRNFTIRWTPVNGPGSDAWVFVTTPALAVPSINISGTGVPAANTPVLDIRSGSPPAPVIAHDFGSVPVNGQGTVTWQVTNRSTSTVTVTTAFSNPRFTLGAPASSSFPISPGALMNVQVLFRPLDTARQTGTVTFTAAGQSLVINVIGTGSGSGGTTSGTTSATLSVDKGVFELTAGFPGGGVTGSFVNRLTPPGYPATLRSVLVFFPAGELPLNTPVTILSAVNASGAGGAQLTGLNFTRTSSTITAQERYVEIPVPAVTINSGDFVVGFSAVNPPNVFPVVVDSVASKQRSYISQDGALFRLIDSTSNGAGNFGIRARVDIGSASTGGTTSSVTAAPNTLDFGALAQGSTSQPRQILITNTGATTLNLTLLTALPYSVNPVSVPNLAPGGTSTVFVTFSPINATPATQPGALLISAAGTAIATVPLFGSVTSSGGSGGPAGTACVAAPANQVSWFAGDGNASDLVGGNNATLVGAATFGAGRVGQAFQFDGSTGYARVGNPANMRFTNALSIEAWINPRSTRTGVLSSILTKWAQIFTDTPDSDSYGLWLNTTSTGVRLFSALHFTGAAEMTIEGGTIPLNTWTHVAMTYDGASGRYTLYVNGQQAAQQNRPGQLYPSNRNVLIGREDSFLIRAFDGLIDEVGIYGRELSAAEIQSIMNAGANGKCKSGG